MKAPSSKDILLRRLLEDADSGSMQLPEFQRDWTWDDDRIRGILASISQNYPMGAIMRLQFGNPDIKLKYRPLEGVETTASEVIPDTLILDGQQRMTSIYLAAYSQKPVNTTNSQKAKIKRFYYFDMTKCLDPTCERTDAIISIPEDKKKERILGLV